MISSHSRSPCDRYKDLNFIVDFQCTMKFLFKSILCLASGSSSFLTSLPIPLDKATTCGSSVEEALELGCSFDIMSYAYYPPSCWDPVLHNEFVREYSQDWKWSTFDSEPLSTEEVLQGNHTNVLALEVWHKYHCLYEWRRLFRAVAFQRPLDEKLGNYGHASHCSKTLLSVQEQEKVLPVLPVRTLFAKCGLDRDEMAKAAESFVRSS